MNTLYTYKFQSILHELIPDKLDSYTIIDSHFINNVLNEVKENLIFMDSESKRINYIKTFLNNISYNALEGWFAEISKVLEFYNNRIHYTARDGKVPPKTDPRLIAIVKFIKWRGELIFNLSELLANIYPGFMFSDLINDTKISANQLMWIERPLPDKERNYFIDAALIPKIYKFCIAECLYSDEYDISNFWDCFDLNKSKRVYPIFNKGKQKYFTYILSLIDYEINGPMAKQCFGIKSYPTEKSRWVNDKNTELTPADFNFKIRANKIFNIVHN